MKDLQWHREEVRPEEGKPLACISTRTDGSIKYTNLGNDDNGPYWYMPSKKVPEWCKPYHQGYFDNEGQPVNFTYWMYWEDFWELLENIPGINPEEK